MRKNKSFVAVVLGILFLCTLVHGEDITWERDGRGNLTGKVIRLQEGESLPVTGA